MRVILLIASALLLGVIASIGANGQSSTVTTANYKFELPTPTWHSVPGDRYINGEASAGELTISALSFSRGSSLNDLAQQEVEQKLQFTPGFVPGRTAAFAGQTKGVVYYYEFVLSGKTMLGRIYYLKVSDTKVCKLQFKGLRDKLSRIQNQTDAIARTFQAL